MDRKKTPYKLVISLEKDTSLEQTVLSKLNLKVLSWCCLLSFLAYLDRGNIGYAAHDLCNDLNLKHKDYGLGVSLFYAGYLVSQVVSNQIVVRFGAPTVLSLIMFAWGCVATAFGLIYTREQFLILRFLLGVAEGGVFPGIWYYLNMFYPEKHVSSSYLTIGTAVNLSMPISSVISAGLLKLDGFMGKEGWRWLFILEGSLPIIAAFQVYWNMAESPKRAWFLDKEEKQWILANQTASRKLQETTDFFASLKTILKNGKWWLAVMSGAMGSGVYTSLMFWTALMIQDSLYGDDNTSETCGSAHGSAAVAILLTAIPFTLAGTSLQIVRYINPKNRPRFVVILRILSGIGLIAWTWTRELGFVAGFLTLCFSLSLDASTSTLTIGLIVNSFDRSLSSVVSSTTNTAFSLGALIIPALLGITIDVFGYNQAVLAGAVILMASSVFLLPVRDPLLTGDQKSLSNA